MTIALITGTSGFVGRHLAARASTQGFECVGLDHAGAHPTDLLSPDAVQKAVERSRPDVVFHLAGLLRAPDFRALYETNVVGTANLLDALEAVAPAATVVLVSSSAVYGNPIDDVPLTEASLLRPLTHYAASKAAQEAVARRAACATSLKVIIARIFNIVGPGQPATLAAGAFAHQVAQAERAKGGVLKVGDLSGQRDFVDVRDVADALLAMAASGFTGQTYNVCSGVGVPMQRVVDALVRSASCPVTVEFDPSRARANDARAQIGDGSLLATHTGWRPRFTFEASMVDLLEACRNDIARGHI